MDKRTSVLIADSSEEFCTALSAALQRTERFAVAGVAGDGEQAMQLLEERILRDGKVAPGNVLRVDSFINHCMDIDLLERLAEEFYRLFKDEQA